MKQTWEELVAAVRKLPPMTPDQKRAQAISFAYGQAKFRNPDLTIEDVARWYDEMREHEQLSNEGE